MDGAPADEDGEDAVAVAMGPVCFAWWDNEQRELGGNKEGLERSVCVCGLGMYVYNIFCSAQDGLERWRIRREREHGRG